MMPGVLAGIGMAHRAQQAAIAQLSSLRSIYVSQSTCHNSRYLYSMPAWSASAFHMLKPAGLAAAGGP
jgi:hypothetical protein